MKVTLIWPPSPFLVEQKAFPPLGILYPAAFLASYGIEVEVADLSDREQDLEDALESYSHSDLYGISATTPQYPLALKILKILRKESPQSSIVVGGAHPSSLPEKCLQDGFDVVVKGEGEQALLQIAHGHLKEKNIEGIVSGSVVRDMDTLPFPARHLIDLHSYAYDIDGSAGTTLFTSRGCPYSCAFCSKDVWTKGVRYHSVQYVIEELNHIVTQYEFKHFLFLDDSLTLNKSRILKLCRQMEPLGIKWRCYARASTPKEVLVAMRNAGCVEVGVGIESVSQKILNIVNKKETVQDNTRFVRLCKEVGLIANVFIMMGLPGETYETIEETRRWMEKVRPQKFGFNIFMPYAGTPIHNHPERYDIRIYDVPDEKSWVKGRQGQYEAFVATSALSRAEILRLFTELFEYYTHLTKWQPGVGKL